MDGNAEMSSTSGNTGTQRLCCPFFIFDYKQYHHCGTFQFRHLSDVRVHCERNHRETPLRCPTCKVTFYGNSKHSKRDAHIVQSSCTPRQRDPIIIEPGVQLNGVSTYGDSDMERRWYFMWDQIFPRQPRPLSIYHRALSTAEQVSRAVDSFIQSPKPLQLIPLVFGQNFAEPGDPGTGFANYHLVSRDELVEFTRCLLLEFNSDFQRAQAHHD